LTYLHTFVVIYEGVSGQHEVTMSSASTGLDYVEHADLPPLKYKTTKSQFIYLFI